MTSAARTFVCVMVVAITSVLVGAITFACAVIDAIRYRGCP